ncbi:MAG: adenylate/guanylate cyclase domain-containing protein [Magnetococcales bacterium]|nr:adenylate/guanylate cyclase domain-containing protein [Magnetococcales bacterium]
MSGAAKKSSSVGWLLKSAPYWASFLVLALAVWLQVVKPPLFLSLRNQAFDTLQRLHPRTSEGAPVRVVDIDDESLARYGQWPWPRTKLADLVNRLTELQAATIAFDIVFAEPDRTSPANLPKIWPDSPEAGKLAATYPDHDKVLAEAFANAPVVAGFTLSEDAQEKARFTVKAKFITAGDDPLPYLKHTNGAIANLAELEEAAPGVGNFSFVPDQDGVIRRVHLLMQHRNKIVPSLSVEALRVAQGARNIAVKAIAPTGIDSLKIGALSVPTTSEGAVYLHFAPHRKSLYVPAWQILEGKVDPTLIAGHILYIGTSAKGLLDLRFSPLGEIIPGVEVHAQLTEQILQGTFLSLPAWVDGLVGLGLGIIWLLMVLLFTRARAVFGAVVSVGLSAVVIVATWFAFVESRLLLDPFFPATTIVLMFLAITIPRHIASERESRWIKSAFSRYVSPNRVAHLVANPDQLNLGGETRECSFVMTDLSGFTTLMERFDPGKVVEILNNYLDQMIKITFRHEGTLDRIVGDAVAVLFSAPVIQEDHAARAVACATEMHEFAQRYARECAAEGIPFGATRIGVHSGTVLVGNFGGETMFDYRALGDPINTSSRLEGANKYFGTLICISGATSSRIPGFTGRPIGDLFLKGKSEAIPTFEPRTAEEMAGEQMQAYMAAFGMLEREEEGALAAFEALVEKYPQDNLSAFHCKRLKEGHKGKQVVMEGK